VGSGALVVSADYRHAPEHRFPTAVEDAWAALQWISAEAASLGGRPGPVVVSGWSAGGTLAAVVSQQARDRGGPAIAGQVLLTPGADFDWTRPSYRENGEGENGEGYGLTTGLVRWFLDHYVDEALRRDPRVAPLRGNLAGLPPATIVTCELDPLRDEGIAYAEALRAAGNEVEHLGARGHTHLSLTMVDLVLSGAPWRARMAEAIRRYHGMAARA
jgi:acetyl esterase/lipase